MTVKLMLVSNRPPRKGRVAATVPEEAAPAESGFQRECRYSWKW